MWFKSKHNPAIVFARQIARMYKQSGMSKTEALINHIKIMGEALITAPNHKKIIMKRDRIMLDAIEEAYDEKP